MKKITQKELNKAIALHKVWALGIGGGKKLELRGFDLRGLDFSFNNLSKADMSGSEAYGANFMGCKLPPDEFLPDLYIGDTWGVHFHGGIEMAERAFHTANNF